MKFRRSIKNDKHESAKSTPSNVAHKDATAIQPPKKVIKALYDHQAEGDPNIYLSFSAGDFLHVVGRENDVDWYEACNPLIGSHGLVPVNFFEEVGKTVRHSGDSTTSANAAHDSGYAEGAMSRNISHTRTSTAHGVGGNAIPFIAGHRSSKSIAKSLGGLYGIVAYDFKAERPDELDAKEGEAIIVIAQSNPEWFVAKPITRLGGPGLIPVSFIEIRDMATGKPVDDPLAAVANAGIPRVEEWKRMAAEYKNTSIPLGTVTSAASAQTITHAMSRTSISAASGQGQGQFSQQASNNTSHQRQMSNLNHSSQHPTHLFAPVRASVPRYVYNDDKFHFVVECKLSNGSHWDLSRVYEDFYELQINLINAFPDEAGQVPGKQRTLPYMPGPVQYVTDNISEGRRASLDDYLRKLLFLQPNITCSALVRNFFQPRSGDVEVDPQQVDLESHARSAEVDNRFSAASATSYSNRTQPAHESAQGQASDPSIHYSHQSQSTMNSVAHARSPSDYPQSSHASSVPPPLLRQTTQTSTASNGPPIKVKVWFDRDTCVVIRLGAKGQFGFDDLYRKIVERRRLEYKGEASHDEELEIEYRDDQNGEYYRLEGDEDLEVAFQRNEKLTVAVRTAG